MPFLYNASGKQVTPSVRGQLIEGGRARDNNGRRFVKRKEGIDIVLEPVKSLEAYLKVQVPNDDNEKVVFDRSEGDSVEEGDETENDFNV